MDTRTSDQVTPDSRSRLIEPLRKELISRAKLKDGCWSCTLNFPNDPVHWCDSALLREAAAALGDGASQPQSEIQRDVADALRTGNYFGDGARREPAPDFSDVAEDVGSRRENMGLGNYCAFIEENLRAAYSAGLLHSGAADYEAVARQWWKEHDALVLKATDEMVKDDDAIATVDRIGWLASKLQSLGGSGTPQLMVSVHPKG